MKKVALSIIIIISAITLFGFVTTSSNEAIQEEQKLIPIQGVEKSGYNESNEASI